MCDSWQAETDDGKEVGGSGKHADRSSWMGDRRWLLKATERPLTRLVSSSELSVLVEHIIVVQVVCARSKTCWCLG